MLFSDRLLVVRVVGAVTIDTVVPVGHRWIVQEVAIDANAGGNLTISVVTAAPTFAVRVYNAVPVGAGVQPRESMRLILREADVFRVVGGVGVDADVYVSGYDLAV